MAGKALPRVPGDNAPTSLFQVRRRHPSKHRHRSMDVHRRASQSLSAERVCPVAMLVVVGVQFFVICHFFGPAAPQAARGELREMLVKLENRTAKLEAQHSDLHNRMEASNSELAHSLQSITAEVGEMRDGILEGDIRTELAKLRESITALEKHNAQVQSKRADHSVVASELGTLEANGPNSTRQFFTIATKFGNIRIKLLEDVAPKHAAFMRKLISDGMYNGCVFYRAEPGFIIQGGLQEASGRRRKKTADSPPLEFKRLNTKATVHMARWENPNSGEGHFSILLKDAPHLDQKGSSGWELGFTVFGEVVEGMSVVEEINKQPSAAKANGAMQFLADPVVMETVTLS